MIRTQLSLFKIKSEEKLIKDIDYIDVSSIKSVKSNLGNKLEDYNIFTKEKYILYKTGGFNKWRKKLGPVFPYIKNTNNNKIIKFFVSNGYVRGNLYSDSLKKVMNLSIHRMVCEAFIENNNVKKLNIVNHENKDRLDYRVDNLEWVSQSQNLKGISKPRDENYEIKRIKNGVI